MVSDAGGVWVAARGGLNAEKALYSTRNSACFSVMTGRDGVQGRRKVEERLKKEGIYVYLELIHIVVQ